MGAKCVYVVSSPMYLRLSKSAKGKRYPLNLNAYRNWHYRISNNLKIKYLDTMRDQILELPEFGRKLRVTYLIYPETNAEFDVDNVSAIVAKFFLDALVKLKRIPDDNFKYVPSSRAEYMEKDKHNPRVEVVIEEL